MTITIIGPRAGEAFSARLSAANGSVARGLSNWDLKPATIGPTEWSMDETLTANTALFLVTPPEHATALQARIDGGTPFALTLTADPQEVTNAGFVSGQAVQVEVRGIRVDGSLTVEGDWSAPKTFTADDGLIGPLGDNLWTVADTGVGGTLRLDFSVEPLEIDARARAYGYTLDSTNEGNIVALADGAATANITGLTNGTEVAVRVWVRNDDNAWGPVSQPKPATPSTGSIPAPGQYGTDDWSVANGGSGTNAIVSVTAHPANADRVEYDLGASGTWLPLGLAGGSSYVITGLTEGTEASIRLRAVNIEDVAGVASTAKPVTPSAVVSGVMTAAMWDLVDEPSPAGNNLAVIINTLPTVTDREVIGFEAEVNGGVPQQLPLGHYRVQRNADKTESPFRHMLILPETAEADVRIRPILRQISAPSGPERLVEVGGWSEDTKTRTPTVGTMSLTIQASATTIKRDEGVIFRAVLSGSGAENPLVDPHFEWDFGEASGDFTALAADFPGNKSSAIQDRGFIAAHAFRTTGTITVTCTAYYGLHTATDTITMTVQDWAANVVTISNTDPAADFPSLLAAMNSLPPTVERQYLLKRGDVFIEDRLSNGASRTNTAPMLVGAYGSGAKPIIRNTTVTAFSINVGASVVFKDVRIEGSYIFDPIGDNALTGNSPPSGVSISSFNGARFTGVGLEAANLNETFSGSGYDIVFSDCRIDGWYNFGFGIFNESGNFAAVGCSARQNPLAQNAKRQEYGFGKYAWNVPWTPLHGSHRQSRILGATCIYGCDFRSINSWASDDGHQPTFRWGTGGEYTEFLIEAFFGNLRLEGGQLGNGAGTTGAKVYSAAKLYDGVRWLSTANSRIQLGHGGEVMRNIVGIFPNVPPEGGGNGSSSMLMLGGKTSTFIEEDVRVENCTFIDLRDATNAGSRSFQLINEGDRRFHRFRSSNLVLHAPNGISGGPTADAPLDMTSEWTPGYQGRRVPDEFGGALQPQFANKPSDAPIGRPLAGSAAIGSATGDRIPRIDINGTVRGASPSRGAWEPLV